MKCYHHLELDGVATCPVCHKALCRACYDAGQQGWCEKCSQVGRQEANQGKIKEHRSCLFKSLAAMLIGYWIGKAVAGAAGGSEYGWMIAGLYAYVGFALYWGLHLLSRAITSMLTGLVLFFSAPLLLFFVLTAVTIGMFAAVPCFCYHLVGAIKARSGPAQI